MKVFTCWNLIFLAVLLAAGCCCAVWDKSAGFWQLPENVIIQVSKNHRFTMKG